MNQGNNLQNYIIFLLLYQKFTIISNTTTNPPAAAITDRARGGRGRGRSNYCGKKKSCNRFRNKTYNNNQGGPCKYRNSRKNNRRDYSGGS
jgi:hypothetical protein